MCDNCGCPSPSETEHKHVHTVDVHESLLAANTLQARQNTQLIESYGAIAINLISGPGSGKTTLLEHTIKGLPKDLRIGVIEGDIETDRDAARIRATGAPVVQLTTGGACHLDARLVNKGLKELARDNEPQFDLIFIENVGNLVCPATFDLGEHLRFVLLSVPEGSDKPAKYPKPFISSQGFLITKIDLLSHFNFSLAESRHDALHLNPELSIFELSAIKGQGMNNWLNYLQGLLKNKNDFANAVSAY